MSLSLLRRAIAGLPGTSSSVSGALTSCCKTVSRFQHTSQLDQVWEKSSQTSLSSKPIGGSIPAKLHSPAEIWRLNSESFIDRATPTGNTYSGRSVQVSGGDVGQAFRRLDAIMGRNNVWSELRKTARHERKGEKRRRLDSERWRRRFKEEVRKRVQVVLEIRRRGA